jgi:hypothetical protein
MKKSKNSSRELSHKLRRWPMHLYCTKNKKNTARTPHCPAVRTPHWQLTMRPIGRSADWVELDEIELDEIKVF